MKSYRTYLVSLIFVFFLAALGLGSARYTKPGQFGKDIVFNRVVKDFPVTFSHATHVKDRKLSCADCHTSLFSMVRSDMQIIMADFKKGKVCGACHLGGKAFGPPDNCTLCHDVATTEMINYQDYLIFSHDSHVNERGFECDVCHDSLFSPEVSKPEMTSDELQKHLDQGRLCGACHNGLRAFPHYVY